MLRSPMIVPPASCGFTGYLHDNAIKHESNIEFYLMQRIHTIEMVEKEINEAEVTFEENPQPNREE